MYRSGVADQRANGTGHRRSPRAVAKFSERQRVDAQQSQGVQQIDEVMLQLTSSVKQVSSSVQDFHQAAENLRDASRVLQQEVGQFTVSGA